MADRKDIFLQKENLLNLLSDLKDAETGQRGYIITGTEDYLEPYHAALQTVDIRLQSLLESSVSFSGQRSLLQELNRLVLLKLDLLRNGIEIRRQQGFDAAQKIIKMNEDKRIMDNIRVVTDQLLSNYNSMWKQIDLDIGRLAIQATWLNFISGLFAGCLITLYSFLFYRDTQKSREVESQLRQMDNLNKAILDSSKQLIMTTNAQGRITFFNKEAEKTLGYEASTVVGGISILDFYAHSTRVGTPEERSRIETFKRSEFDTLVAASKYLIWTDSERVMKRKNGQLLSCSQTITALRDENNEIKGYLFIGSDLTDYKKWEKDLRNAREAIETAQLSQNQFLVSLSHDLKVPLNLTMNFSSLLMKNIGGNLTDQEISYASRIHDNCQSILNLINRMVEASKSEINS